MDNTTILSVLGGAVILICIIIAMVIRYKSKPSAFDKDAATKFLEGLSETFYDKIMDIINNIDLSKYNSLIELEDDVLNNIYDTIWDYVQKELKEAAKTDIITALSLKILNKEFVNKFVNSLIRKYNINWKLESKWTDFTNFESKAEKMKYEDKSEFTGDDYIENASDSDLKPAQNESIPEEELAKLNPQTDEEEKLDPATDSSVEIVSDSDDITVDKKGRKHSKSTGKYV